MAIKLNETAALPSLGIDIGSTTAKVVLTDGGEVVYDRYERHFSFVRAKTLELINDIRPLLEGREFTVSVSGSAGMGLAEAAGLPFVHEVYATGEVVRTLEEDASAVIELGGEDAKILFLKGGFDERMNGSCAGGTGAFIDQMATLLDVSVSELDRLSAGCERIYPIASRCGVFAKSDIQPLLNQGARKEDIAASIYRAVVNQTVGGLAQGRRIEGRVVFLGGPLYYCTGLRRAFVDVLGLKGDEAVFPEWGRICVAMGAAVYASSSGRTFDFESLVTALESAASEKRDAGRLPALFENDEEYAAFRERHARADVPHTDISEYTGDAYLGIDCGSTTTKLLLMAEDGSILYTYYDSNRGNPVEIVRGQLSYIYSLCGTRIHIRSSAVTGYGEELVKSAFGVDFGIVETMAHFTAARHFDPDVDFIIDIGGQDIKCFKVKNNSIDSIALNEACSSGCGSFIETFARSMGYGIEEFARLGITAKAPVDLGSRCTVFMNSSVKQAQKDGADVSDISAGLSVSVVKNAVYKVIRAPSADDLGKNIVVQGGTFYNDAVLRAFERELGRNVIRPVISGVMGAYGAALTARDMRTDSSALITKEKLENFVHETKGAVCHGCGNGCRLTVNIFDGGRKFISGNQCERGLGIKDGAGTPNMYEFKRNYLYSLKSEGSGPVVGLPLALGMYETAPLWHGIFTSLGCRVLLTGASTKEMYSEGQFSIPSDTVCYPAKLMHGHIAELTKKKPDAIFYPRLTYNTNEHSGKNHYNCPVVAYYSDLLSCNVEAFADTRFVFPYLNINSEKELARELYRELAPIGSFTRAQIKAAVKSGFEALEKYKSAVRAEGERVISLAREKDLRIMVLAGRPYHIDPEVSHGIDKLACSLGFAVVSEDAVAHLHAPEEVDVLDQWTYHSRLYRAAHWVCENDDAQLVQLVSFGCGIDAITTDEVRSILESRGKLYTQIKIDEITNLGAVKIRLRSMIGALEERGRNGN